MFSPHALADNTESALPVIPASDIQQPEQQFAYVLGDVLIQRVRITPTPGLPDLSSLSRKGRVGEWLERQSAHLNTSSRDGQWLELRYQIINSPEQLVRAYLPELEINYSNTSSPGSNSVDGSRTLEAWPFTLGPLTIDPSKLTGTDQPPVATRFLNALLADHTLAALDITGPRKRLQWALKILLGLLLVWGLWWLWRERRDKTRLPFAEAHYRLGRLRSPANSPANSPVDSNEQAWKILHAAFNQQAGQTVNPGTVNQLILHHPWLRPMEPTIQDFFDASAAQFFELPARPSSFAIKEFANALYLAEKKSSV